MLLNGKQPNTAQVVDLTQPLFAGAPRFDAEGAGFCYEALSSVTQDGCACGAFRTEEHFGTHMDAPVHFVEGGCSIDEVPAHKLIAEAFVIDVRPQARKNPDYELSVEEIKRFEGAGEISAGAAVLMLTGWSEHYRNPARYRNADRQGRLHFPGYSASAAGYLVENRRVGILGIDTLSVDPGVSADFPVHKIALGVDTYLVENLKCLDRLPARGVLLFCAPLPILGGTGSPARVLAILPH